MYKGVQLWWSAVSAWREGNKLTFEFSAAKINCQHFLLSGSWPILFKKENNMLFMAVELLLVYDLSVCVQSREKWNITTPPDPNLTSSLYVQRCSARFIIISSSFTAAAFLARLMWNTHTPFCCALRLKNGSCGCEYIPSAFVPASGSNTARCHFPAPTF